MSDELPETMTFDQLIEAGPKTNSFDVTETALKMASLL